MLLAWLSASFQSLPLLHTSKLGPTGAGFWVGGFVYILGPCGSLQLTLLRGWSCSHHCNSHRFFHSEVLRLYFPVLVPWVSRSVSLPSSFSWFICTLMWDRPVLQPGPCCKSSPPWLPVSTPPTGLDECFFINSLVVRLPQFDFVAVPVIFLF